MHPHEYPCEFQIRLDYGVDYRVRRALVETTKTILAPVRREVGTHALKI